MSSQNTPVQHLTLGNKPIGKPDRWFYHLSWLSYDLMVHIGMDHRRLRAAHFCSRWLPAASMFSFALCLGSVPDNGQGSAALPLFSFFIGLLLLISIPIVLSILLVRPFLEHLNQETGGMIPDPDINDDNPFDEIPTDRISFPLQVKKLKVLKKASKRHWQFHARQAEEEGLMPSVVQSKSLFIYYWLIPFGSALFLGILLGQLLEGSELGSILVQVLSSGWFWATVLIAFWVGIIIAILYQTRLAKEMAAASLAPEEASLLEPLVAILTQYRFKAAIATHLLLSPLLVILLMPSNWGASYAYMLISLPVHVWVFGIIVFFNRSKLPLYQGPGRVDQLVRALFVPSIHDVMNGILTLKHRENLMGLAPEQRTSMLGMMITIPLMPAWIPFILGNAVLGWMRAQPDSDRITKARKWAIYIFLISCIMVLPTILKTIFGNK